MAIRIRHRDHGRQRQVIIGDSVVVNQFTHNDPRVRPFVEVFSFTTMCVCSVCSSKEFPEGWPTMIGRSLEAQTFGGPDRDKLCDEAFEALWLKYETMSRAEVERLTSET